MAHLDRDIISTVTAFLNSGTSDSRTAVLFGLPCVGKSSLLRSLAENRGSGYILADLTTDRELRDRLLTAVEMPENDSVITRISTFFGLEANRFRKTMFLLDGAEYLKNGICSLLKKQLPSTCLLATERADFLPTETSDKIRYFPVYPLSFSEFLCACGHEDYRDVIRAGRNGKMIPKILQEDLEEQFYDYLLVGGFPQAVLHYIESRTNLPGLQMMHRQIFSTIVQSFTCDELPVPQDISPVRIRQIVDYYRNHAQRTFAFRPGVIRRGLTNRQFVSELRFLRANGFLIPKETAFPTGSPDFEKESVSDEQEFILCDSGLLRYLVNDYDAFYSVDQGQLPSYIFRQALYQSCSVNEVKPSRERSSKSTEIWKIPKGILTISFGKHHTLQYSTRPSGESANNSKCCHHNIQWFELDETLAAQNCLN